MSREFTYGDAVRSTLPLLLGIAGPTGSGKTFSALRLATGMQRVTGGDIGVVDTEAKRATAYDRYFKFKHLDFPPPFGPLDYRAAIETCVRKGAKNIVVDSMTHEHSGQGGVLEQIDAFLDKKCGDDFACRDKNNMLAHKQPKADRKELNNYIVQVGREGVNFIFCYRADEKVKPMPGKGIVNMGMSPDTTSKLVYEMMAMFLLTAASDGHPNMSPITPQEKLLTKLPLQFRDLILGAEPLSEDIGQKFAEWAKGGPVEPPAPSEPPPRPLDELKEAGNLMAMQSVIALETWWSKTLTKRERQLLKDSIGAWKEHAAKLPK